MARQRPTLKPLSEQVMVITGASSGIGLTTARLAAREGARLVLAARNAGALEEIADEIEAEGGEALAVACDVGDYLAVKHLAERAIERFGRIDTWVNNAGVALFAEVLHTPVEDHKKLFDTNYWGVVHGSIVAVHHLRDHGGALINMGSVLSDRAVPLQGAYSASKAAIKALTDALRMEVEHDGLPVAVTLIQPASIATPFEEHARAYTENEPRIAPPRYAPELVARAILEAAAAPTRERYVGNAGRVLSALSKTAPRLVDRWMEGTLFKMQQTSTPRNGRRDNLFHAGDGGRERSKSPEPVIERRRVRDRASERPAQTLVLGAAIVLGIALLVRGL